MIPCILEDNRRVNRYLVEITKSRIDLETVNNIESIRFKVDIYINIPALTEY